ncbi:MAG: DinB family protein [Fimbriimonadaceae bacterium]
MDSSDFLDQIRNSTQDQINRMRLVMDSVSDEVFNRVPAGGEWTPGQVTDHLIIANTPYLAAMTKAIEAAPHNGPSPVTHTFFGKLIISAAGPTGNAPAPKSMIPPPPPTRRERADLWFEQMDILLGLIERSKDLDISKIKIKNPFVPLIRMNLADFFKITTEHTERHVQQIEQRSS